MGPADSRSGLSAAPSDNVSAQAARAAGAPASVSLLVLRVGRTSYAMPVHDVIEVVQMVATTPAPDAPAWSSELINFRGRVVPLIDTRVRLGLDHVEPDLSTPIVVMQIGENAAGLIVDEVVDVVSVPQDQLLSPAPATPSASLLTSVARLDERLILVLDQNRICDVSELSSAAAAWQMQP